MTQNEIEFSKLQETIRHQMATEAETSANNQAINKLGYANLSEQTRHAMATETETNRSNLAKEYETNRSNVARETETHRNNLATETETNRANLAREKETNRSNKANEKENKRSHKANEANQRYATDKEYEGKVAVANINANASAANTAATNATNKEIEASRAATAKYVAQVQAATAEMQAQVQKKIAEMQAQVSQQNTANTNATKAQIAEADRLSQEIIAHNKNVNDAMIAGDKLALEKEKAAIEAELKKAQKLKSESDVFNTIYNVLKDLYSIVSTAIAVGA